MEDQGAARTRSGDGREREHDARAVHRNLRASCNTAAACALRGESGVRLSSCWPRRVRYVELIICVSARCTQPQLRAPAVCWLARAARHKRNSTSLKQNRFGSASPLFDAGVKLNRCRRRQNSRVPARCVVASLKSNAALSRPLLELVCRKVSR